MEFSAFSRQHKIMASVLPLSLTRKLFNRCILPVLTYVSETQSLKLPNAQEEMERMMLGITQRDRKRKRALQNRKQTKVEDILTTIKLKIRARVGHVMRRKDNRWTTRVTEWQTMEDKRRPYYQVDKLVSKFR